MLLNYSRKKNCSGYSNKCCNTFSLVVFDTTSLFEGPGVAGALALQSRLAEGTAEPPEAEDDTDILLQCHPPGEI